MFLWKKDINFNITLILILQQELWAPTVFPFVLIQYGFNMVMAHPQCVNEIALSLNNKNPR